MQKKNVLALVVAILASELAGVVGSFFTRSAIPTWYAMLNRPEIAPPNWLFGPVWVTLYFLMGIAAFLVWRKRGQASTTVFALRVFGLQLVLNALWSIIFFGGQSIFLALVEIVLLWLCIVWTMVLFAKISRAAAWLLVPYILWVSFATYLNYSFWIVN